MGHAAAWQRAPQQAPVATASVGPQGSDVSECARQAESGPTHPPRRLSPSGVHHASLRDAFRWEQHILAVPILCSVLTLFWYPADIPPVEKTQVTVFTFCDEACQFCAVSWAVASAEFDWGCCPLTRRPSSPSLGVVVHAQPATHHQGQTRLPVFLSPRPNTLGIWTKWYRGTCGFSLGPRGQPPWPWRHSPRVSAQLSARRANKTHRSSKSEALCFEWLLVFQLSIFSQPVALL